MYSEEVAGVVHGKDVTPEADDCNCPLKIKTVRLTDLALQMVK